MVLDDQGLKVNPRHVMLVADVMTYNGKVQPIGRQGVSGAKTSVFARAAFEETVKHLHNASIQGTQDELKGITENIIVGQPIPVGTGLVKLGMK
jgi:DNA-directed RNA polymerase subunit A"